MVAFGGEDAPAAVAAVPADNGAVRVSHPADWTVGGSARVPGLTMPRPITLAAPDGAALTAGLSAATGLTLLPEPLRARVRGGLPPADGVRLGALAGLRYEGVRLAGAADRRFDLYVAATTGGVYTAACQAAPDGLAAVRDACGSIAASVRLLGGRRPVPLAPNAAYGRAVRGPLERYSTASSAALAALRDAGTRGAQASAAGDAAAAARTLAGRLAGVAPGPQIADRHAALVDAARGLGRAYAALAAAGRAGSDTAWDAARRRVGAAGDALELAQADLAKAGYPPR
jgi:hypothetical protein